MIGELLSHAGVAAFTAGLLLAHVHTWQERCASLQLERDRLDARVAELEGRRSSRQRAALLTERTDPVFAAVAAEVMAEDVARRAGCVVLADRRAARNLGGWAS